MGSQGVPNRFFMPKSYLAAGWLYRSPALGDLRQVMVRRMEGRRMRNEISHDSNYSGPARSATEQELLAFGFARIGSFQNGRFAWETAPEPVTGVYVMVLDGKPFNIGEARSLRNRLHSYAQWLARRYDKGTERHNRELKAQKKWAAMTGDKRLDIYVRSSDNMEIFGQAVPLHKAEEEALTAKFLPPWNARSRTLGAA
jgi:hypothetical protein